VSQTLLEHVGVNRPAIAVHGGAGDWAIAAEQEEKVRVWLSKALEVGYSALLRGGSAVEAVVEAVAVMEDSGLFNAGAGSALNAMGYAELDAGVMDGTTMSAGAVAAVRNTRNAVRLARVIMDRTSHVMLCCDSAEKVAQALGYSLEGFVPSEAHVKRYRDAVEKILAGRGEAPFYVEANIEVMKRLRGVGDTVGAVAIDAEGRLASATSTGGIWLKLPGRIGDSPIPGAGFYADSEVACSATGLGEAIMTISLCRTIALASRFIGGVAPAIAYAFEELEGIARYRGHPQAGAVVLTSDGDLYMAFNTRGMARGYLEHRGSPKVYIHR